MTVAILVRVAMSGDAFPSSEVIWIQSYAVTHLKCLYGLEQLCKDQEAKPLACVIVVTVEIGMNCTCELSLMSLNTSFLS